MALKGKKEAIDSHGLQMTLVAQLNTWLHCGEEGGIIRKSCSVILKYLTVNTSIIKL